jgi:hypothetical protein
MPLRLIQRHSRLFVQGSYSRSKGDTLWSSRCRSHAEGFAALLVSEAALLSTQNSKARSEA